MQVNKLAVDGEMPVQTALRIVRQNTQRWRSCYEVGLKEAPDKVAWSATVRLKVSEMGTAVGTQAEGAGIPSAMTKACLVAAASSMRFPLPPRGSPLVNLTFELSFAPGIVQPPTPHF